MQEVAVFVRTYAPPPRMLVFGAIDHAAATARIGAFLGYRVTVCDARPAFATRERFPTADEVVRAWPHTYLESTEVDARTAICVLTHDPKFDVPLLVAALRTPAAYIGVMGSRRTHHDRLARLRAAERGRGGARPPGLTRGPRPRSPYAGGDGCLHRGRDRPAPLGRHGTAAGGADGGDPPPRRARPAALTGAASAYPRWSGGRPRTVLSSRLPGCAVLAGSVHLPPLRPQSEAAGGPVERRARKRFFPDGVHLDLEPVEERAFARGLVHACYRTR